MVRVTQILYPGLGGHASVSFSLISGDTKLEWSSSLLFVGIERVAIPYRRHCENFGIPFEAILTRRGQSWRSWPAIYRVLRHFAPDVVILHSATILPPVLLYRLLHGVKIIVVEHTSFMVKTLQEHLISAMALIFAQRIVLLTNESLDQFRKSMKLLNRARKLLVVPNGIDISTFFSVRRRQDSSTFRIGMAARFTPSKCQDLLVQALALLKQKQPEIDWQLTLAGEGECLAAVRRATAVAGVSDKVEFTGFLDEQRLIDWFRSLDLYAHASQAETLSISMLQAMSMALPIVGSAAPGIIELLSVNGQRLGVLAENSPQSFADAISAVQVDSDLQVKLATAVRCRACSAYSHKVMFKSYNDAIQECLK